MRLGLRVETGDGAVGALAIVFEVEAMTESKRQAEPLEKGVIGVPSDRSIGQNSSIRRIAVIDQGVCTLCGACASSCPQEAMQVAEAVMVDGEACSGCGVCVSVCPVHAVGLLTLKPRG